MTEDTQHTSASEAEGKQLSMLTNLETLEKYPLEGEKVGIGRQPDNQIVVGHDMYASSYHAVVYLEDGCWWLKDLGSRNGSMLNAGLVTEPVKLKATDVITIGRTKLEIG